MRQLMLAAHDLGMLDGTYVFLGIENIFDSCTANDGRDTEACKAFEGFININVFLPKDTAYNNFAQEVYQRAPEMGYNIASVDKVKVFFSSSKAKIKKNVTTDFVYTDVQFQVNIYSAYLHDSIYLYAKALNASLEKGNNITDGNSIIKEMFGMGFYGKRITLF